MADSYEDLKVWKKSFNLTLKIYKTTNKFPKKEDYGLTSQMRRASVSIMANIVEGHGRRYLGEFIKYVSYAIGSCNELGVYLLLAKELEYINNEDFKESKSIQVEVSKMLFSLRNALDNKLNRRQFD